MRCLIVHNVIIIYILLYLFVVFAFGQTPNQKYQTSSVMFCWMFSRLPRQNRDGSYTGFIKVQFKLARPVSLPPSRSTSSSSGWDGSCQEEKALKHRTSFYLPRDTVKHLHISSNTRAREVIEALLKKFTVVDNPAKFSLFERSERQTQGGETICASSWFL